MLVSAFLLTALCVIVSKGNYFNINQELQTLQSYVIPRRKTIANEEDKLRLVRAHRNGEDFTTSIVDILSTHVSLFGLQDQLARILKASKKGNREE